MSKNRILFITHDPFSVIGSNGKTYLSLFSEFEDAEVAQLFFNNLQPSTNKFSNFFKAADGDLLKYILTFKKISGNFTKNEVTDNVATSAGKRSLLKSELIKVVRNFLFTSIDVTRTDSFKKWIEEFQPKVIFCIGTNYIFQYEMVQKISRQYGIPYFMYFTDDYFLYNKGNNPVTRVLHDRFVLKTKKIVEDAEELFVISPKMKEEYISYFNKECSILINAVDKTEIQTSKKSLTNPITFRYFGWLHSSRSQSLGYLGKCLEYINLNSNYVCKLEVYSLSSLTDQSEVDLRVNSIEILKPIMGEAFHDTLNNSDFLVHAESFDKKDTQVTMLSVSTKIPEYLLSNRCIVAVGPSYLASVNLILENDLGIALSGEDVVRDSDKISTILGDMSKYNEYCENSIKYYWKEFDSKVMKSQLKRKMLQSHA